MIASEMDRSAVCRVCRIDGCTCPDAIYQGVIPSLSDGPVTTVATSGAASHRAGLSHPRTGDRV